MAYGGIRNLILRIESGVSLLVGYRLEIATMAGAEIWNGYHIINCHPELNISQQFGMHKKEF